MNNIFHDFFYQDETGKTHKRYGNVSFDGNFFQSYYTTVAAIIQHPQKKRKCRLLLLSSNTMSSTTSRHLSQIHSAANGIDRILRVPFSWGTRYANVDTMLVSLARKLQMDMKVCTDYRGTAMKDDRNCILELHLQAVEFKELFPALVIQKEFKRLAEEAAAINLRKEANRKERKVSDAGAGVRRQREMLERVARRFDSFVAAIGSVTHATGPDLRLVIDRLTWQTGSLGESSAEQFGVSKTFLKEVREVFLMLALGMQGYEKSKSRYGIWSKNYVNSSVWLDASKDEVVTSKGVRISTQQAKMALLLYQRKGEKVVDQQVNHMYPIKRVDEASVSIGCHTIAMDNIRALGAVLGVSLGDVRLPTSADILALRRPYNPGETGKTSDSSDLGRDQGSAAPSDRVEGLQGLGVAAIKTAVV